MPIIKEPETPLPEPCWERLPDEPLSAYKKFQEYLSLGAKRNYREVARLHKEDSKGNGYVMKLVKKYQWLYRATMYDMNLTKAIIEKNEEAEMAKRTEWNKTFEAIRKPIHEFVTQPHNNPLEGLQKVTFALKGNNTNFLIGAHKALFGEKHQIDATVGPKVTIDLDKLE